jgi:hypothetical protein
MVKAKRKLSHTLKNFLASELTKSISQGMIPIRGNKSG